MDGTVKVDQQSSEHDLYAALMLSNLLDSQQDVKDQQEQAVKLSNEKIELEPEEESNPDVIWVPADKHPEIAPTEFANFIKTHGANTPTRKSASLHRRKSILSQSLSVKPRSSQYDAFDEEEEEQLKRTLSEKKRHFLEKVMSDSEKLKAIDHHTFDRNSTSLDDSRIIAPLNNNKSLLRRSAFSARGRSRKTVTEDRQQAQQRRSLSQRKPSTTSSLLSQESNKSWDKSEGISLYDQPVNMSEWIDLGSASLESDDSQRGILSRVHDAESQLRSQLNEEGEERDENKKEGSIDSSLLPPSPTSSPKEKEKQLKEPVYQLEEVKTEDPVKKKTTTTASTKKKNDSLPINKTEGPKRPGIIRSTTESSFIPTTTISNTKTEKRSSWLSGLFQGGNGGGGDKKNHTSSNNNQKKSTVNTVITNNTSSPLFGLATLFTRSLSMKSNISNGNHTTSSNFKSTTLTTSKKTILNNNTTNTTITTNTLNNTNNSNKKKRSSRLEIPPPSERTFFNTNRLPLHVERAIYRLSHMKLADPRRPLRQQVLISNLMFWYLSIQQNDHQQQEREQQQQLSLTTSPTPTPPLDPLQSNNNKKVGKMSRLIHSAKKRKSEVAQFVQLTSHETTVVKKPSNVQFSLAPIPSHHHSVVVNNYSDKEEDDVPLSHYRS